MRRFLLCQCAVLALICTSAFASGSRGAGQPAASPTSIYIPIVIAPPRDPTVFGVETTRLTAARGLNALADLGATWVRRNGLSWNSVEPVEGGGYTWNATDVQALEQDMINASRNNLRMVLIVRIYPRWATEAASNCGPIRPDKYASFASFLAAAVARYSRPPYNVRYWEIGNEPDAPLSADNFYYGCWGDPSDVLYGGRAYGEMLKVVYPAIKAANPEVQVLNGGLLLDHPYDAAAQTGQSARFLEGVFAAGASESFDILAYHSYSYYMGASPTPDGTTGPVDWKVGYLRTIMDTYGVRAKPLFDDEGALLCATVSDACHAAQADAIGRKYARALRDGLLGANWYVFDSDSWYSTALVSTADFSTPRPAYIAYRQAVAMLGGAAYEGRLTGQPAGVEGYRFRRGDGAVTVVWSNTPRTATIPVSAGATVACVDRDGQTLACTNSAGAVSVNTTSGPAYVVEQ